MDIEKLISSVYNRQPLWDKHSKNYNNRDIAKQLWSEVASEMGIAVADIKKKWSNLRDQFRKEYNKCNGPSKSGAAADHKSSSWTYYDSLLFLAKQIAPKTLSGNFPATPSEEIQDDTESLEFSELSPGSQLRPESHPGSSHVSQPGTSSSSQSQLRPESQPGPSHVFQPGTSSSSQAEISTSEQYARPHVTPTRVPERTHRSQSGRLTKKRNNNIDVDQEYLEIEKRKLQLFESRSADKSAEDPDRNFLLSLLPYLKEVPRNRKISVQRKLLDVFFDEQNTQYSPVSSYSVEHGHGTGPLSPDSGDLSSNMSYVVNIEEPLSLTTNQMTPSHTSTSVEGHLPLITNQMTMTPSQTSIVPQGQQYSFTYADPN